MKEPHFGSDRLNGIEEVCVSVCVTECFKQLSGFKLNVVVQKTPLLDALFDPSC